ncbi:MAG: hypothetical protein ACI9HK_000831 [Pirellulaceae bacterium]|jgi:hypothetical protein
MLNLFDQFVDNPVADTYLALREKLLMESTYSTLTVEAAEIAHRIEQRRYQEALELLDSLQPGCLLSPRLHMQLALIGEKLGDSEQLEVERFLFRCCLDGILDTGSGDRRSPFIVTHSTDVVDILSTIDVQKGSQFFVEEGDRRYDIIHSTTGEEYCFDVTDVLHPAELEVWRHETLMN